MQCETRGCILTDMLVKDKKTIISDYAVNMLRPASGKAGVLFLSGGSALAEVSEHFSLCKIPSVHLITPFDSGGSSRALRIAFGMPAVGDIRNRILSLSRIDLVGHALPELCTMRFACDGPEYERRNRLKELCSGKHAAMMRMDASQRKQVADLLGYLAARLPEGFSLQGASLGNLILVGAYLHHGFNLYAAVEHMSTLLQVEGTVLPVVDDNLHLAASLADGSLVVGQHLITGKEVPAPDSPIGDIFLTPAWPETDATPRKLRPRINSRVSAFIERATCICYPMGSFYTSLLANLLPEGVGMAISKAPCYKVYVPSAGVDPEARGLSVADQVERLLWYLRRDAGENVAAHRLVSHIFYDSCLEYSGGIDADKIAGLGVELVDTDLILRSYSSSRYEPYLFMRALSDLIGLQA